MLSPLSEFALQYMLPVFVGVIIGLFFKMYFAARVQKKIRDYQGEIVKSHSRILHLEELNTRLERQLKERGTEFSGEQLFMN